MERSCEKVKIALMHSTCIRTPQKPFANCASDLHDCIAASNSAFYEKPTYTLLWGRRREEGGEIYKVEIRIFTVLP